MVNQYWIVVVIHPNLHLCLIQSQEKNLENVKYFRESLAIKQSLVVD